MHQSSPKISNIVPKQSFSTVKLGKKTKSDMIRIKDKPYNKSSLNKATKTPVAFEKQHDQRVNEEDESSVISNENIENIENQQEIKFISTHDNRYSKLLSSAKEYQHPRHESEVKYIQSSPLRNSRFSSSPLKNKKEHVFTEDEIKNNDVYHRLFKDSKIKQIKDNEFTEFLKFK